MEDCVMYINDVNCCIVYNKFSCIEYRVIQPLSWEILDILCIDKIFLFVLPLPLPPSPLNANVWTICFDSCIRNMPIQVGSECVANVWSICFNSCIRNKVGSECFGYKSRSWRFPHWQRYLAFLEEEETVTLQLNSCKICFKSLNFDVWVGRVRSFIHEKIVYI